MNSEWLDFDHCVQDSPAFRNAIVEAEKEVSRLEEVYQKTSEVARKVVKVGQDFYNVLDELNKDLNQLSNFHPKQNVSVADSLGVAANILCQCHRQIFVFVQRVTGVNRGLEEFVSSIKELHSNRKKFEKVGDAFDAALQKAAGVSRSKPLDCEEADRAVATLRVEFRTTALEYARDLRLFSHNRNLHALGVAQDWSQIYKEYTASMVDFETKVNLKFLETVAASLTVEQARLTSDQQLLNESIKLHGQSAIDLASSETPLEGYLFKRSSKKPRRSWSRRWFTLRGNQLTYYKRSAAPSLPGCIIVPDLRLCTAKVMEGTDRRYCFEVIVPLGAGPGVVLGQQNASHWSHHLQADSPESMHRWVTALQSGMVNLGSNSGGPSPNPASRSSSAVDISGLGSSPGRKASLPYSLSSGVSRPVRMPNSKSASCLFEEDDRGPMQDRQSRNGDGCSVPDQLAQQYDKRRMNYGTRIVEIPGNEVCCDCGAVQPQWASSNLGVTLCAECAGLHRSLGVQISKVRSPTLDNWEPELLRVMLSLGNRRVNEIFEGGHSPGEDPCKPTSNSDIDERRTWIRAKWVLKQWVRVPEATVLEMQGILSSTLSPQRMRSRGTSSTSRKSRGVSDNSIAQIISNSNRLLCWATRVRHLPLILASLGLGADPNCPDVDDEREGRSPLMRAVESGSLAACQLLLDCGAQIQQRDKLGRSALHHAVLLQHTLQVCLLLKRGADQSVAMTTLSGQQETPLQIALRLGNADIVTLLRLQLLNASFKESDGPLSYEQDETVNDVFRDFTNRAYDEEDQPGPVHTVVDSTSSSENLTVL